MKRDYKKVQRWYNENIDNYLKNGDLLMKSKLDHFLCYIPKRGLIVDLGSGTGRDVEYFSEKGFKSIGIDFSKEMILYARKNRKAGIFRYGDIIKDVNIFLKKANNWLKKRGVFGFIAMKKSNTNNSQPPREVIFNRFSFEEINNLLNSNNLKLIHFQEFKAHNRKWFFLITIKR
jgi:SAM-dependent methyltransferase